MCRCHGVRRARFLCFINLGKQRGKDTWNKKRKIKVWKCWEWNQERRGSRFFSSFFLYFSLSVFARALTSSWYTRNVNHSLRQQNHMHVTRPDADFCLLTICTFPSLYWYSESVSFFSHSHSLYEYHVVLVDWCYSRPLNKMGMWWYTDLYIIFFFFIKIKSMMRFSNAPKSALTIQIDVGQCSGNARFQARQCQEQTIFDDFHCDRNHILRNKCFIIDGDLPLVGIIEFEIDFLPLINRLQFIGSTAAN